MEEKGLAVDSWKKIIRQYYAVGIMIVLLVVAFVIALIPKKENEQIQEIKFSSVEKICELATLRCYYHNVAEEEKQPDGLFKYGLFKYGYKKIWLEYDGIIEVGVDVAEVDISDPVDNIVMIYVPEAKIMGANADKESMGELISDKGVFTTITGEDQANMFALAQESMKENAANDTVILYQARNNAKKLLEEYVINLGEQMGMRLTVKWSDEPLD